MSTHIINEIDLEEIFSVEKDGEDTILHFRNNPSNLIIYDPGLYHTAICKSSISKVDKRDGMLYYRGVKAIDKLCLDFLDVAYEVIFGNDDNKKRNQFKEAVHLHFKLLPEQKNLIDNISPSIHPMDMLGMATIALGGIENKYMDDSSDLIEKAGFIIAQVAISVCYYYTKLQNKSWTNSSRELDYAHRIMQQMHGNDNPKKVEALSKVLNTIMILHCEHGQNCSAATVRNVASSRGGIYPAVASGMAAFNGSIHGGASQYVSAMYEEILNGHQDVNSYVDEKVSRKELLMGFGQRTYNRIKNCWDPRVKTMFNILTDKSFDYPEVQKYKDVAIKLTDRVTNDPFFQARNLTPNPDLFNCIFFKLFGVPSEMNTVMLGLGRIVGWVANYIEHTQERYPLTRPCDLS